jgi:hypothetical protein
MEKVRQWLIENRKDKRYENRLCHILHLCIDDKDIDFCNTIIQENNVNIDNLRFFEQQKQIGLLLMQYHLLNDDLFNFNHAFKIYKYLISVKQVRKRHINICLKWLIDNKHEDIFMDLYMNELLSNFIPDVEEVYLMLKIQDIGKRSILLDTMVYKPLCCDLSTIDMINGIKIVHSASIKGLKKYPICEDSIRYIQNRIKDIFKSKDKIQTYDKYMKWLDINCSKYDIVIDGANILFSCDGKPSYNGYKRIDQTIDQMSDKRILLILHERHFKILKSTIPKHRNRITIKNMIDKWVSKKLVYSTPYNMNDDLFLILASIRDQKRVLTNDKFRDHIFNLSDRLIQWKWDYGMNYIFHNNTISICQQSEYSVVIQRLEDGYYIPTYDDDWIFIPC